MTLKLHRALSFKFESRMNNLIVIEYPIRKQLVQRYSNKLIITPWANLSLSG